MQMNGRTHMSILQTMRLSMALWIRSGTYVNPTATSCSTLAWSACLVSVVVMIVEFGLHEDEMLQ
jgi:hypothetical protein